MISGFDPAGRTVENDLRHELYNLDGRCSGGGSRPRVKRFRMRLTAI
jgi:hypothetical protein